MVSLQVEIPGPTKSLILGTFCWSPDQDVEGEMEKENREVAKKDR